MDGPRWCFAKLSQTEKDFNSYKWCKKKRVILFLVGEKPGY